MRYCTAIEQSLAFAPTTTLQTLFNQLDLALRKQYRPLENAQKEKTDTTAAATKK